jgi:hypothetical protein
MYHCKLCNEPNDSEECPCWKCVGDCEIELVEKLKEVIASIVIEKAKKYNLEKTKLYFTVSGNCCDGVVEINTIY